MSKSQEAEAGVAGGSSRLNEEAGSGREGIRTRGISARSRGGRGGRGDCGIIFSAVLAVAILSRGVVHADLCMHQWDIDDCMECEKIMIDGRHRVISFCKEADTTTTDPALKREISVRDIFWDPGRKAVSLKDEGMYVWQWKPVLRECLLNSTLADLSLDDFLWQLQYTAVAVPSIDCNRVADFYCQQLGGRASVWRELPLNQCCALANKKAKEVFFLSNTAQWHCKCGSGVRRDAENCDDGNLNALTMCHIQTKDGCSQWCSVEEELGYDCTEPSVNLDYTAPVPPSRKSECKCNCDCALECTCQNKQNRDYCGVRDDGSLVANTEFICCGPYVAPS